MVYQDIEFFNVDHLESVEGMSGLRLHRFPASFSKCLGITKNYNARFRSQRTHGCELRFVTEARYFDVALTVMEQDMDVVVYRGDMQHKKYTLKAGVCTVLHIEYPPNFDLVRTEKLPKGQFSPDVWRIQFGLNGYLYFHYLDTFGFGHRPPRPEEEPAVHWAAYGSSITCGSACTLYSDCYINQAAVRLGWDVLNKGLSGSCLLEPEVADYLAGLSVDVLSLEVGVNMVPFFEEEEAKERIFHFLSVILEKSQAKRIYVIDIFPNKNLIFRDENSIFYRNYRNFKRILREFMETEQAHCDGRMCLIHGEDIVESLAYLSTDVLHPSDNGHIRMGEKLAAKMQNWKETEGYI